MVIRTKSLAESKSREGTHQTRAITSFNSPRYSVTKPLVRILKGNYMYTDYFVSPRADSPKEEPSLGTATAAIAPSLALRTAQPSAKPLGQALPIYLS